MADINDLIAQGAGRRDFSPLGEIFGAWRQGVQARNEDALARARASLPAMLGPDGQLDYGAAALHLLRAGDVHGAAALAHVARATVARSLAPPSPAAPRTRAELEQLLRGGGSAK